MKKIIFSAVTAIVLLSSASAYAGVWVSGPFGTYYQPTCASYWTAFGWQQICN